MPRLSPRSVLRRGLKAIEDLELHKVLQAEINYELMNKDYMQKHIYGSSGDFKVDWDSTYTRDLVLHRKCKSGEEIAVSAIPSPGIIYEFPRKAFMKVCVKKPALSSILQFDCEAFGKDDDSGSDYKIRNAYYLQSPESLSSSIYRGPTFSDLDPRLQDALKGYLVSKGIGESLINFLIYHLCKRDHDHYLNWLQRADSFVKKGEKGE